MQDTAIHSPPASPSKRAGLLRQLVTGVHPVDRETHAQRWQRPLVGPRSPSQQRDMGHAQEQQMRSGGHRVSALVQGYEASLSANTRRYEALLPSPPSPHKGNFPVHRTTNGGTAILTERQDVGGSPRSPTRQQGTSPTVPAAFFQRRQHKHVSPDGSARPSQASDKKENQPCLEPVGFVSVLRPPSDYLAPRVALTSHASASSQEDKSSRSSTVSRVTDACTDLSAETMATRSSDSTHASSLVTNSAEHTYVGIASVVNVGQASRHGPATGPRVQSQVCAPSAPSARPDSLHPNALVIERPLLAQRSTSSFVEALSAPNPRDAGPPQAYQPLALDSLPRPGHGQAQTSQPPARQAPPPQAARRNRPRSSSLGAGPKPSAARVDRLESAQERANRVERDFERLLDTLQLPDRTVRIRMLGLALPLKEEMLRAATSNPSAAGLSALAAPDPSLRPTHMRGRSLNVNLGAIRSGPGNESNVPPPPPSSTTSKGKGTGSGFKTFLRKAKSNGSVRSQFVDQQPKDNVAMSGLSTASRARSRSFSRAAGAPSGGLFRSLGRSGGTATVQSHGTSSREDEDAQYWAARLRSTSCAEVEAKEMGRLRTRLRNETPVWVDGFIKSGGYLGLLERLKELLGLEWREEQHDDQLLHEVLRCFKALTLTPCGKRALASHSPTPFLPLAALLFSEKRPGDLPSRQILVELVHAVYDICPPTADSLPRSAWSDPAVSLERAPLSPVPSSPATCDSAGGSGGVRRYTRKAKSGEDGSPGAVERDEVLTPERVQRAHRLVLSLMRGPPSEDEDSKVDFILAARKPRLYKTWVKEMADTVRDYFWVFCHSDNLFWTLEQIDADAIEAPKVPSGMTGGVEHEAMAYCATHFRLVNTIARTFANQQDAFDFHEQLFLSGFERVLFTLRRASLVYYQTLHLEMSRYISLARSARFNLGPRILACLDRRFLSEEERLVLRLAEERHVGSSRAHTSSQGAPQIGNIF